MQHRYTEWFRWIMVIPGAVFGWWMALLVALLLTNIPAYFCPPEQYISGVCMTAWYGPVLSGIMIFGAALSAVLTLLVAVLIAPKKRNLVAKVVFVAGSVCAVFFAFSISAWGELAGAIVAGLLTLLLLTRKSGRDDPDSL